MFSATRPLSESKFDHALMSPSFSSSQCLGSSRCLGSKPACGSLSRLCLAAMVVLLACMPLGTSSELDAKLRNLAVRTRDGHRATSKTKMLITSLSHSQDSESITLSPQMLKSYDEAYQNFDNLVNAHIPVVNAQVAKILAKRSAIAENNNRRQRE